VYASRPHHVSVERLHDLGIDVLEVVVVNFQEEEAGLDRHLGQQGRVELGQLKQLLVVLRARADRGLRARQRREQ
jgi:hypothetical protein